MEIASYWSGGGQVPNAVCESHQSNLTTSLMHSGDTGVNTASKCTAVFSSLKKRGGGHAGGSAAGHHLKGQYCLCHHACVCDCACVCHCLVSTENTVVYSALLKKRGGVHTAARHHLKVQDCLCHCVCAFVCICVCHCLVSTMYSVVP